MNLFTLALLALTGCKGCGEAPDDSDPDWVDDDADGYASDEDCNDDDPDINPAADEICDGVDNDCDEGIDDDAVDAVTYWTDADEDGYGDPATEASACEAPADSVAVGDDCDDDNADNNPDGVEVCDGADNDCDGEVDNEALDPLTFYEDADADTYGNPDSTVEACYAPDGYVEDSTDCDDSEDNANPGLDEQCDDGIDNDCDGTDNGCSDSGTISLANSDVIYLGEDGTQLGTPARGLGDMDGDGSIDLAASARAYDGGVGAVYFLAGPISSGTYNIEDAMSGVIVGEADDDALFGIWPLGDMYGDGDGDLVVSAKSHDTAGSNAGRVYVFDSMPTGELSAADATAILDGEAAGDQAGVISYAGDVTGDGINDLLASATNNDSGGSNAGAVYVVEGPATSGSLADSHTVLYGAAADDKLGSGLAAAGDLDGDGVGDWLVGVPYESSIGTDSGGVLVFHGGSISGTISPSDADWSLTGEGTADEAGWGLAQAGDHDGDGLDDFLASARRHDSGGNNSAGAVYLVTGTAGGDLGGASAAKLEGGAEDDKLSNNDGLGDLNGDGDNDIVVGSNNSDEAADGAGAAYVFFGPVTGTWGVASADVIYTGQGDGDGAASPVGFVGDTNDDGLDDLFIGARTADIGGTDNGAAYLVFGSGL
ncbi:MAG TPA: putative metal-binding motif-containing protein [Myxococcota bacterium]|nr:putative metal-binding motif-containing protein [Myxococcota bacterium]